MCFFTSRLFSLLPQGRLHQSIEVAYIPFAVFRERQKNTHTKPGHSQPFPKAFRDPRNRFGTILFIPPPDPSFSTSRPSALKEKPFALKEKSFALKEKLFVLKEKPFALKEKPFALKEKLFALKEKAFVLKEKLFALKE